MHDLATIKRLNADPQKAIADIRRQGYTLHLPQPKPEDKRA